jgi:hypothetical protein
MHEILRDLENFGKMLELLKNAKVKAMETPHIKLVFDTEFEEIEDMPKAIGFSQDEDEDIEEEEVEAVRKIGFDIPTEPRTLLTRLNLKEMK